MDEFDRDAVFAEIERLARATGAPRPVYFDRFSQPTAGAERITSGDGASLSRDDILAAKVELAEQHHVGLGRVENLVRLTHQRAGTGYSESEQADVIREVAMAMERGESEVSDSSILALAGLRPGDAEIVGTFGYSDGSSDDEVALAGVTQETKAALALAAGQDSASAVILRHPELAHLFRAGKTSRRKHPKKSGRGGMLTTDTRAHSSDTGDEATQDPRQPARGGEVHADVRRLIKANPDLFADEHGREGEGTGNISYGPRPGYPGTGRSGKPQSRLGGRDGFRRSQPRRQPVHHHRGQVRRSGQFADLERDEIGRGGEP